METKAWRTWNGSWPVSMLYRITPADHTSMARPAAGQLHGGIAINRLLCFLAVSQGSNLSLSSYEHPALYFEESTGESGCPERGQRSECC